MVSAPDHHAEPEPADRRGHHEAVLDDSAAERDDAEQDRQGKADLVEDGMRRAGRPAEASTARTTDGGEAMDEAKPGQRDGQPVHRPVQCCLREHRTYRSPCPRFIVPHP